MRVLITGSRIWAYHDSIHDALVHETRHCNPEEVTVVHGGAAGADMIAGLVAQKLGYSVEVHRAEWDLYGKRAGAIRNAKMAKLGADICLAFLGRMDNKPTSGTSMMIGMAKKAGIEVKVYES